MDGSRFDSFTRTLGTLRTRRQMLGALTVAMSAALWPTRQPRVAAACSPGLTDCGGVCVDIQSDYWNCGGCGITCGLSPICAYGTCWASPGPGPGPVLCGGAGSGLNCMAGLYCCYNPLRCIDIASDPANCGGCDNACPAWQTCQGGVCAGGFTCMAPLIDCNGVCVDSQTDPANCGGCGITCPSLWPCAGGVCQTSCPPPYVPCGFDCIGLGTFLDCTACGDSCANYGFTDPWCCGGACTDRAIDPGNCGACGVTCAQTSFCDQGVCKPAVAGGPCPLPGGGNGVECNGACVDLQSNSANCGSCGNACMAGASCENGACHKPLPGPTPPGPTAPSAPLGNPDVAHDIATSKGVIHLYSSWPMRGDARQRGEDMAAAIRLALEHAGNAAGGFSLSYEPLDDAGGENGAWDEERETENAHRAAGDQDAMVYLGPVDSAAARIAIPILNRAEGGPLPIISPANSAPGLTRSFEGITAPGEPEIYYPSGTRNYLRVAATDDAHGVAGATWARNDRGIDSAWIIHDDVPFANAAATLFADTFVTLGGELYGFETVGGEDSDHQELVDAIASSGPGIIYLGALGATAWAKLLRGVRDTISDDDLVILGPEALLSEAFTEEAGPLSGSLYLTSLTPHREGLTERGADIYQRLEQHLKHDPDELALSAYEAAVVVIQAIDRVGENDRKLILEAMRETRDFQGLTGTWRFTQSGDVSPARVSLFAFQDGESVFQQVVTPAGE